jgi:hypothetical protein
MDKHASQLANLLDLKKAQHRQMDDHWKCMETPEPIMKKTDNSIMARVQQNLRLTAQMTGLHLTTEMAATSARNDINDLRARLIPDLCDAPTLLLTEVQALHGCLSTLVGKSVPNSVEFRD